MAQSVAFFIFSLERGGAERVTSILANKLAARKIAVTLLVMKQLSSESYQLDPSVTIVKVGDTETRRNGGSSIIFNVRRIFSLRRYLKENNIEVLITMMTGANIIGIAATLFSRIKCVGSERIHPGERSAGRAWDLLRKYLYGSAHCIVLQTESGASWAKNHTNAKNVKVVANPLEFPLKASKPHVDVPDPSYKLIIGVGRLISQKQFQHLISAFSQLSERFSDWKLAIVGNGEEENMLREQVSELGLTDKVFLPGRVGNLGEWYQRADLFVMTSAFEGYPNALIEAMAYQLPVISYDCRSGPAEIIKHDHNGLLIELNNQSALVSAMEQLMTDSDKSRKLGENAGVIKELLDADRVVDSWIDTFV
jgi:glycosyltransferase involved in cell wall biosynthesis